MKTYREFCSHYALDPSTPDARQQYRDYLDHSEVLRSALDRQDRQDQQSTPLANQAD